ncbi:glycoside hydrolase family 32 protein [Bremerella sp. JC817]|uniref:glycoside hydrolase family 32 protein n=1 Tax=Bremerella sp. JC817 TaxID=3231756 RepID=UPI0034587650
MKRSLVRWFAVTSVALTLGLPGLQAAAPEKNETLIADFEGTTYGDWQITGDAFGTEPAAGTLPAQMDVSGFAGKGLVNSFRGGDKTTGTLTSPSFTIERPFLNFLIGGGGYQDETCMNLIVDGKAVRTATGPNRRPGGTERLQPVHWNVESLQGKQATLQIVDNRTGGWGHINVDDIWQSETSRGIPSDEIYQQPNMQTFPSYGDVGYDQTYRPQFHFTSQKNWLNDPNGMVYFDGEYHLFFQHNPHDTVWGNMTWGHAVSPDMVHWKQLPHAILPYDEGTIFSGTAVVDHNNSLGVQQGDTKTLVAAFTFARSPFYQAIAYSTDRGRTFQLWNEGKAVVENQGYDAGERDPKIFWHEPSQKWVMVLWVQQGKPGRVLFFQSDDLKSWKEVSQFDRDWVFECMDLVELPVDGNPNDKRWVLYDASFEYEIGKFDGKCFLTDEKVLRGDYGPNFYAAQTFNDSPDDRTVIVGWMRGENVPFRRERMPFHQQMSFPQTMQLKTTADGVKLFRWPIEEIKELYQKQVTLDNTTVAQANEALKDFSADLLDISIAFEAKADTTLTLDVRGQTITYRNGMLHYQNATMPAPVIDGQVQVRVLVDRASVELFVNSGEFVATFNAEIDPQNLSVHLGGSEKTAISKLEVHQLGSAWK